LHGHKIGGERPSHRTAYMLASIPSRGLDSSYIACIWPPFVALSRRHNAHAISTTPIFLRTNAPWRPGHSRSCAPTQTREPVFQYDLWPVAPSAKVANCYVSTILLPATLLPARAIHHVGLDPDAERALAILLDSNMSTYSTHAPADFLDKLTNSSKRLTR
jgi:hypothetical protein